MGQRWRRAPSALAVLALLAGAACTAKAEGKRLPPTSTTAAPTTTAPAPPPPLPLTGLPAPDLARVGRQALVVKIENHPAARPQSGLDVADVVYEEQVEGGLTRFIAVFQSRDADVVGPVRSVRPSDGEIVWPLKPLFAYAGGTDRIVPQLHKAPVVDVGVDAKPDAYYRKSGRNAPHNLYTSTGVLYRSAPGAGAAPVPLFTYLDPKFPLTPSSGAPVSRLSVSVGDKEVTDYVWDPAAHAWTRTIAGVPHKAETGAQIAPTNVIVQFVNYRPSLGDTDAAKSQVFAIDVVGSGDAWVLTEGRMVKGKWTKATPDAVTMFSDATGKPMSVTPGSTWVELVPVGGLATVR